MSDETVTIEAEKPTKKKATRNAATEKKSGVRYFAFARPNMEFCVPAAMGSGSSSVNVNGFAVVVGVDDPALTQVLETASTRSGGIHGIQNSDMKEVAGDLSDGEKRLIGAGLGFNAQAFRSAFEGLKRL